MGITGGISIDHVSPFIRAGVIPEQSSAYIPGLSAVRHDCSDTGADTRILPMPLTGRLPPPLWMGPDLMWMEVECESFSAMISDIVGPDDGGWCSL